MTYIFKIGGYMVFKLIIIIFIISVSFKDKTQEQLKKDKKDWERIMGREYD